MGRTRQWFSLEMCEERARTNCDPFVLSMWESNSHVIDVEHAMEGFDKEEGLRGSD